MTAAAHRQRLHRERAGKIVLQVEVDEAALAVALVDAGLIAPEDQDDPAAAGQDRPPGEHPGDPPAAGRTRQHPRSATIILTNSAGIAWQPNAFRKAWGDACRKARSRA